MRKDAEAMQTHFATVTSVLDQLDRRAERMELILMVREPGSAAAADAYEGLRKQVVAAVTDRLAHLTQLVQFDAAIRNGANLEVLRKMVIGWSESAGLGIVSDATTPDIAILYEIVDDQGGELEVIDPAYVDTSTGRVIRQGRARRLAPVSLAAEASPQVVLDVDVSHDQLQEVEEVRGPRQTKDHSRTNTADRAPTSGASE